MDENDPAALHLPSLIPRDNINETPRGKLRGMEPKLRSQECGVAFTDVFSFLLLVLTLVEASTDESAAGIEIAFGISFSALAADRSSEFSARRVGLR